MDPYAHMLGSPYEADQPTSNLAMVIVQGTEEAIAASDPDGKASAIFVAGNNLSARVELSQHNGEWVINLIPGEGTQLNGQSPGEYYLEPYE